MDDQEFERAVENLLRQERKKEPYYLESVEQERVAIVMAFYDHFASLLQMQKITTVDDFLESLQVSSNQDTDEEAEEVLIGELSDLIQEDLAHYTVLLEGEMLVNGHGVIIYDDDSQDNDEESSLVVDEIEEGMVVTGDIQDIVVAPMVSYEAYASWSDELLVEDTTIDELTPEIPGLWLRMNNVTISDEGGQPLEKIEQALLPFNYPTLKFHKLIRQSNAIEKSLPQEEVKAPVITHFKGDFIIGVLNDKENDLNYNDYTPEDLRAVREAHRQEISIYMSAVEQDEQLTISAHNALDINGQEEPLSNVRGFYRDSVFIKSHDIWRIVHTFLVQTDGDAMQLRHILPEDITAVFRNDEH